MCLPDSGYLIPMCGICVHTVHRGRHSTACQHRCEVPLDKGTSHETVAAGHHHGPGQQVLDSASECTKTQEHNKKQASREQVTGPWAHLVVATGLPVVLGCAQSWPQAHQRASCIDVRTGWLTITRICTLGCTLFSHYF